MFSIPEMCSIITAVGVFMLIFCASGNFEEGAMNKVLFARHISVLCFLSFLLQGLFFYFLS